MKVASRKRLKQQNWLNASCMHHSTQKDKPNKIYKRERDGKKIENIIRRLKCISVILMKIKE